MDYKNHCYRVGSHLDVRDDVPTDPDEFEKFVSSAQKRIEPWLSAVFQAEHLNLLLGSGFTTAISYIATKMPATGMDKVKFGSKYDNTINTHAEKSAKIMGRGSANIEDQFRSALAVLEGLKVTDSLEANQFQTLIDTQLATEQGIVVGKDNISRDMAVSAVQSFLLSFASRAASRNGYTFSPRTTTG